MHAIEKIQEAKETMYRSFPERSNPIDGLFTGLIAGCHSLLLGPPGTAKSMLVRSFADSIGAGNGGFFQYLMNKTTTPEEIFGAVSFKGLKEDRFERVTTGKLPEAKVVFLDEIWKSSSHIMQSLLTALNERMFFNGINTVHIPMLSCIGASNEYPEDGEGLEAVFDRFQLRFWVDYLSDNDLLANLMMDPKAGERPVFKNVLTDADISELQEKARSMPFSKDDADLLITLKAALQAEGFLASDRTWVRSVLLLKARAVYNGHDSVKPSDYRVLADSLWNDHTQRPKLFEIISKICNPIDAKISKIMDGMKALVSEIPDCSSLKGDRKAAPKAVGEITRINMDISTLIQRTEALRSEFGDDDKILSLLKGLNGVRTTLATKIKEITSF